MRGFADRSGQAALRDECKNGVSSYEIARALGVTQKTAWFMLHRIRYAMHHGTINKMTGTVEADETFIGGKARFMHADKRAEKIHGRGPEGKTIVFGLLDRETGKVRTTVVSSRKKKHLQAEIRSNVTAGASLYTDALKSYNGLDSEYAHKVIDHAEAYVGRLGSYKQARKLLEFAEALHQRHVC